MNSPYTGRPARAFWRTGVSEQHPLTIEDLYRKKFSIEADDKIATAGSCFAQHIARKLNANGYQVLDVEPAPPGMDAETARQFGYGLYSGRYGNIYTTRQLLQLATECFGMTTPQNVVWERDGRYYDALRPSVEPQGLDSPEEVLMHRKSHVQFVRRMFRTMNLFIFTFGLTEAWIDKRDGTVYPTAPGTIAGSFDPEIHEFKNFTFSEVMRDFLRFRELVMRRNPDVRILVTVSPVPLTATASDEHVLAATTYSKSVLRAVAGELAQTVDNVDYFPSYEIIASPFSRGFFYESNLRSVDSAGVANVMRTFFDAHGVVDRPAGAAAAPAGRAEARAARMRARRQGTAAAAKADDVVCEEALMEAFNRHA